ncbi:MAG: hypothetical protein IKO35_04435 [Elusimicrobiaceae bacterium]|nr:hypothetical protein [Elusimicrobiaceae bacterium]
MIWFLTFLISASAVGLLATTQTRTAKLARMARASGCTFDKNKDSITTQLTAGRLEFFTLFFHQYHNVFTYSDHLSFIRLADDIIYLDDKPKTKPIPITIFTAELKNSQFPLLKAAPLKSPFAPSQYALMKTNIPAIDARYRIHAPSPASGLLFTPMITGLLKTRPQIYLELNDNAMVYHEHALVPVEELESFRFRAMQILGDLETLLEKIDNKEQQTDTPQKHSSELRASAMLQSLDPAASATPVATGLPRSIWFFALLLIFLGISFFSWFVLRHWIN